MFWILESNLYSEENFTNLVNAIERFGSPYTIVKRIPIFNVLLDADGNEIQNIEIPSSEKNTFVCGSTGMGSIAKQHGLLPGYFDENLDYELVMKNYGRLCLNHRGIATTMRAAPETLKQNPTLIQDGRFFVRPVSDKKSFAGTVFGMVEFDEWYARIEKMESENREAENSMTTLKLDDKIILAPLSKIFQEFRFFVVDKKIVTSSMYKIGNKVLYSDMVPDRVRDFAQQMADKWSPNRAYCLDIAVTEEDDLGDMKVIEINALNSAGFYACDMNKFVAAINDMEFE